MKEPPENNEQDGLVFIAAMLMTIVIIASLLWGIQAYSARVNPTPTTLEDLHGR